MDRDKAFSAVTLTAAENCGIADRVGSIEKGKDADIAIFTGNPVDFGSECVMTFINGKKVYVKK